MKAEINIFNSGIPYIIITSINDTEKSLLKFFRDKVFYEHEKLIMDMHGNHDGINEMIRITYYDKKKIIKKKK